MDLQLDLQQIGIVAAAFLAGLILNAITRKKKQKLSEMAKIKAVERVLRALDLEKGTFVFICEEEYERYQACKKAEDGLTTASEKISK